jgi:hypothetical protein
MTDKQLEPANSDENRPSCEEGLSRKEFIALVVKRAAIAGAVVAAPKVLDKFLVPPVEALTSTGGGHRP